MPITSKNVPKSPTPVQLAIVVGRLDPAGRKSQMQVMSEVAAELERIMPGMKGAETAAERRANVARSKPLIELILLRRLAAQIASGAKVDAVNKALAKAGVKHDKPGVIEAAGARLEELEKLYVKMTADDDKQLGTQSEC